MKPRKASRDKPATVPEPDAYKASPRNWRDAIPHDRLSFLVKEALRGFTRSLQVRLTEHSVSIGHYVFLRVLWVEDGITQRDLSERAGLMESTTCTAIQSLEKLGYILRVKKPGNNKRVYVFLTPKGKWLKTSLRPAAEEINQIATEGMSEAHVAILRRCLVKIIDNFAADEARWASEEKHMPSTRDLAKFINGPS